MITEKDRLKKREIMINYHDLVTNCPIPLEEVWNIEFTIRDIIEEKGYDLINFCSYPLSINGLYMGHYNSIIGYKKMIKLLYIQFKELGYECYYDVNKETPMKAVVIFPKNLIYELYGVLNNKIKDYEEMSRNGVLY